MKSSGVTVLGSDLYAMARAEPATSSRVFACMSIYITISQPFSILPATNQAAKNPHTPPSIPCICPRLRGLLRIGQQPPSQARLSLIT